MSKINVVDMTGREIDADSLQDDDDSLVDDVDSLEDDSGEVLPDWKNLKRQLRRVRKYLHDSDQSGSYEGLVALDMFMRAVEPGMPYRERVYWMMYGIGWISSFLEGLNCTLPEDICSRAGKINSAVGDSRELWAQLMPIVTKDK